MISKNKINQEYNKKIYMYIQSNLHQPQLQSLDKVCKADGFCKCFFLNRSKGLNQKLSNYGFIRKIQAFQYSLMAGMQKAAIDLEAIDLENMVDDQRAVTGRLARNMRTRIALCRRVLAQVSLVSLLQQLPFYSICRKLHVYALLHCT